MQCYYLVLHIFRKISFEIVTFIAVFSDATILWLRASFNICNESGKPFLVIPHCQWFIVLVSCIHKS